jgi:hypothetical protein
MGHCFLEKLYPQLFLFWLPKEKRMTILFPAVDQTPFWSLGQENPYLHLQGVRTQQRLGFE